MARRDPWDRPVVAGVAGDEPTYRERARRLGLPFAATVKLAAGSYTSGEAVRCGAFAMSADADHPAYIAPTEEQMPLILRWLAAHPAERPRITVSTPAAIRVALIEAGRRRFTRGALGRLAALSPDLSARRVATSGQLAVAAAAVLTIGLSFWQAPVVTLLALNIVAACFFFGMTVLRFIAASQTRGRRQWRVGPRSADQSLPVYTILVPLYREAAMIRGLVAALDRIDWPRQRLDVKLIVEADDTATIGAAERATAGSGYELVVVPKSLPRTKPKALAFAFPFIRGELVTIYDAEDRPHPAQLREAFAVFSRSGRDLACLQAPILIHNQNSGLLARLFAIEYSALFDGLLPALAALGMPLPLGGTSNHFRSEALAKVGGWDPFNVTEDADLGIRLARFGYRSDTITMPTYEEAPAALTSWLRQRTRWFKGWMQTWLVHTRRPVRLARELGRRQLAGFNLVSTGLIVSALIHPVYLGTLVVVATDPGYLWGDGGVLAAIIVGVNLFNLVAGYIAMAVLARRTLALRGRGGEAAALAALPLYWLLMSVASYRALFQLVVRPHHWEKTPHRAQASLKVSPRSEARPARPRRAELRIRGV